ncbi:LysR family transcriptional regulator [Aneurinibacillus sp. Ricciae_BoGa-3]|uniref:LysR family transcriptional regulator n=1 Tax=Aneurinibacillus sp. Ricciae_BoGa-3 TaxID=3022697 RepID=UPI0023424524|nr:LysR family transcriptional regulator [Aneurinibacillus sp. Ricciae_BoGa-3]WCK53729.1 LysR family transcriptional regulator [Aneurinibacillus sp. Ricciae_BoGa-3]
MDLDWIRCFLLCAEQKSLSKAAELLNLTQPAVSKQIQKLEAVLCVELLKRSPQGVELTEAGRMIRQRITPLLSEFDCMIAEIRDIGKTNHIVLGSLPSLAAFYIPEKLVKSAHADIHIETRVYDTSKLIIDDMVAGNLDAGLIEERWVPNHVWSKPLFSEPYDVVYPYSHHLSGKQGVFVNDLISERLVMYPPECDIRQTVVEVFDRFGVEPNIAEQISFRDFILGMVAAGAGITLVPRIISAHIGHLPLQAKPIKDYECNRSISLTARTEKVGKLLYKLFA